MSRRIIYLFTTTLLILSQSDWLGAQQPKSESAPLEPHAFLIRVASERESLVQYQCTCDIKVTEGENKRMEHLASRQVKFEYSRIDDHFIVFSNRDPTKGPTISWNGRSGKYWLRGDSDTGSELHLYDPERNRNTFSYFDVRAVGLGFCGEYLYGHSFEKLISARMAPGYKDDFIERTGSIYRLSCPLRDCNVIDFDASKGFWPVKSTFGKTSEWNIQVEKVKGKFVPTSFSLKCPSKHWNFSVGITWDSINQPMSVGREAAERIAKEFKVKLIAPTDKELAAGEIKINELRAK